MPRLRDIVNDLAGAAGDVGRSITRTVTKGAEIANDVGKTVVDTVDKTTRPAREFAEKAGTSAKEGLRSAGKFYVNNRERVDAAMIAYPVGQTIASSAIARGISAKLLGMVGLGASAGLASFAVPILFAAGAAYFGKDIIRKAEEFLKQGDTIQKARKGDANAIKTIADTIAAVVVHEKPEAEAQADIDSENNNAAAQDAVQVFSEPANINSPLEAPDDDPQP